MMKREGGLNRGELVEGRDGERRLLQQSLFSGEWSATNPLEKKNPNQGQQCRGGSHLQHGHTEREENKM